MRVTDPSIGDSDLTYSDEYVDNALVRVSTNRVFAGVNEGGTTAIKLGDPICQPDSERESDTIGHLCAYIPLTNGKRVDVGVRTAAFNYESPNIQGIPESVMSTNVSGVRRSYSQLVGETVYRIGLDANNTGYEACTINAVSGSPTIQYQTSGSGDTSDIQLVEQLMTDPPSYADVSSSGSPVIDDDGKLLGIWIGTDNTTNEGVITPVYALERALGASALTSLSLTSFDSGLEDRMFTGEPIEFVAPPDKTPPGVN